MGEVEHLQTAHAGDDRLGRIARDLAKTGLVEDVCEQLQAELIAQWLAEPDLERRERCWHEVRAVEVIRERLAMQLAPVDSQEYEAITGSSWTGAARWRRWIEMFRQALGRLRGD